MDEKACICDDPDDWCRALTRIGHLPCPRCGEHHRHPETCEGITPEMLGIPPEKQ